MTQTQAQQLTRAEAIAVRDELHAIKGTTKSGQVVYGVLNRTETKRNGYPTYHLLRVDGLRITCDCYASQRGRVCAHRAAVRAMLIAERESELRYEAGWVPAMGPGLDRDSAEYDENPSETAAAWA